MRPPDDYYAGIADTDAEYGFLAVVAISGTRHRLSRNQTLRAAGAPKRPASSCANEVLHAVMNLGDNIGSMLEIAQVSSDLEHRRHPVDEA